jgi:hypothetical protein
MKQLRRTWRTDLPTLASVPATLENMPKSSTFEVSDTCVFDRPQAGRLWFEGIIRDDLDIGRPDQIAIIFGRAITRRTPGVFRTHVLTRGVAPALHCQEQVRQVQRCTNRSSSFAAASRSRKAWRALVVNISAKRSAVMPHRGPLVSVSERACEAIVNLEQSPRDDVL